MKQIFLILTSILFFFIVSKGQNISLDQVVSLNNKSLADVEEFLSAKNWELIKAKEPADGWLGSLTFAYKKEIYEDKAESFLTYYYSRDSKNSNRTNIQIHSTKTYNVFLARLKSLGFKLLNSYVEDGEIKKTYTNKANVIEVSTSTHQDDFSTKTNYHFFVQTSSDYTRIQNSKNPELNNAIIPDDAAQLSTPNIKQEADDAYEANDYKNASRHYLKLYNSGDIELEDLQKLGYSYYKLKNYKNAIIYLKKYEAENKDDASTKDIIASSYHFLNDFNSAIRYSLNAIKLDESNIDYYNSLGWYYILNKNYKKALESLEKANSTEIDSTGEINYYVQGNLAHAYLLTGNYEKAKSIYIKYKGIFIDNSETWNSMVLKDFDTFKKKNITSIKIPEITKLLKE